MLLSLFQELVFSKFHFQVVFTGLIIVFRLENPIYPHEFYGNGIPFPPDELFTFGSLLIWWPKRGSRNGRTGVYILAGEMINLYSQLVHDPGCIGNKLYVYIYIYIC